MDLRVVFVIGSIFVPRPLCLYISAKPIPTQQREEREETIILVLADLGKHVGFEPST